MIAKVNELLCANRKWHKDERKMMICYGAILMNAFVTLALTCYWALKNQAVSTQIICSLLVIEIVCFALFIFFLKRSRKLCNEFYDKANKLAKSIYKVQHEQSCEKR